MALINCPECGKEISDKAKNCIHCGAVFVEKKETARFCSECGKEIAPNIEECPHCGCPIEVETVEGNVTNKKKKGAAKKIVIPLVIIAIIAVAALFFVKYIGSSLSEDEQLAYQNAVEMRSMMRDPDSFKLYDEFFILKHHDDDGAVDYTYTVFKYGGANGYGAITTDEAIFRDGEYIMDYADDPDEDDAAYMKQLEAKAMLALYVLSGGDSDTWEKVDIDVEKIKKKMRLE